jgi:hypothetical protein
MYKPTLIVYSAGQQAIYNLEKGYELHRFNYAVIEYWGFVQSGDERERTYLVEMQERWRSVQTVGC